jgi:hypothetical protein
MTPTSGWIQEALLRIQNDFLDDAALALTPSQAARRFGLDRESCEAILAALLESGVLAKTPEGAYVRFFPRLTSGVRGNGDARSRARLSRIGHAA